MTTRGSIYIFFLFYIPLQGLGQNKKLIDSLNTAFKSAADTDRVQILNELAQEYRNSDPGKSMSYARQTLQMAEKFNNTNGIFNGYMQIGLSFERIFRYDSALVYLEEARKIAEKAQNLSMLCAIYGNLGNLYGSTGQNRTCIKYYLKSAECADKMKSKDRKANMYCNIGTVYSVLHQQDTAMKYYSDAAEIISKADKNDPRLSIVYDNMGAAMLELKDTAGAEKCFKQALQVSSFHNNKYGIANGKTHLAMILHFKGSSDSALAYCSDALKIYEEIQMQTGIAEASAFLGQIYFDQGKTDEAIPYLVRACRVDSSIQDYYNLDNYYLLLSEVFEKKGDYRNALYYHKKMKAITDTVYSLNKSTIVDEMKAQYESDKKQKEIEILHEKDLKNRVIIYSTVAGIVLLLLLVGLAFNRFWVKKKASEKLTLQNAEIQQQKEVIEAKNKSITDSIHYAKRIQDSLLPTEKYIHRNLERLNKN